MFRESQQYCLLRVERRIQYLRLVCLLAVAGVICCYASPALSNPAEKLGQWRWSGVERVVVIPDIHGAYPEFTELLKASAVINSSLQWIAGKTHLVSLGDLLDRGAKSREVMDLLMRLQTEAREHGGRVHVVAGNHEAMNLVGDLRYVSLGEFAAFSDIESAQQRNQAYGDFAAQRREAIALSFLDGGVTAAERNPKSRQVFEELYPPGYFGHRSAFAPKDATGAGYCHCRR